MDKEDKRKFKVTILGIIGIVALLIGTSFAVFTTNLSGTKSQAVNTGCLKVEMGDNGNLSLTNSVPKTDKDGLNSSPYTYTLSNTCTVNAFYTSTLNIVNTSNSANLSKVKIALSGDTYVKPTMINALEEISSVDSTETNISKTYKIDEGTIAPGDTKTFNVRSWIDYDVESFTGNLVSKVIVKSEARGNSMINYETNTAGYTVLKTNTIINNDAYSLIAPSANQTTGIIKVGDKYYYRGNPTNNYLTFAGKSFRILSTNSDGSINIVLATPTTNSTYSAITTSLNTFYSSISSEESYIKTTNTFCEEKTASSVYSAISRLENHKPITGCSSNNFMTKIGLLSVDDLMYAGAVNGITNNSFYLASSSSYWTNSWKSASNVYTYTTSSFNNSSVSTSLGLKPVITLKANTLLEGNGTSGTPYYVSGTYDEVNATDSADGRIPTITYARVDDKWSNQNKYIEISAKDDSNIAGYYIGTSSTKPSAVAAGWEASSAHRYTSVNSYNNGTYYAFAKDQTGNVSDGKQIIISKVDKTSPTCLINIEPDDSFNYYKTLKVTGTDSSGIDPNGYTWNTEDFKNDVAKIEVNGLYTATVTDLAGNKGNCSMTVSDIIGDGIINATTVNGTIEGKTSKIIKYNGTETFNLTPTIGYRNGTISCTNGQTGTLENNVLTVSNVTESATCTVTYTLPSLDESGANEPVLSENMIPVYYDDDAEVWKKADSTNLNSNYQWYDYDNKMWANSVTVSSTNRDTYKASDPGTPIPMSDILTMQVWIPRYKYTVWNYNLDGTVTSEPQEINIQFERGTRTTGQITCTDNIQGESGDGTSEICKQNNTNCTDATCNGKTYTHPAFTFGDEEVEGIWVGKFESSSDTACTEGFYSAIGSGCNLTTIKPLVKPDVMSWRGAMPSVFENNTMAMNDTNNMYGFATTDDTHMMKNQEWGAVAYLSHSKYGANREVYINNSESYYTGRSGGNVGGSTPINGAYTGQTSTYQYNSYGFYTYDGYLLNYDTNTKSSTKDMSKVASTTGNIYGIYDMSGGAWEYVMGNIVSPNGTVMMSGYSATDNYHSGYTGILYDSGNYTSFTGSYSYPDNRYLDKYSFGTSYSQIQRSKLGDAVKEVKASSNGWYSDYSYLASTNNPWFKRGGYYYNGANAGLFGSSNSGGDANSNYASRFSITP